MTESSKRKKIACLLADGLEDSEFRMPYDRLRNAGYDVDIIARGCPRAPSATLKIILDGLELRDRLRSRKVELFRMRDADLVSANRERYRAFVAAHGEYEPGRVKPCMPGLVATVPCHEVRRAASAAGAAHS